MKFRKLLLGAAFFMFGQFSIQAQNIQLNLQADSTFNAADLEPKTFKGFDVDIQKVGVVNIGMQVAFDAADARSNHDEVNSALANRSFFKQRADLIVSSALPERTNVYATLTFVNPNGGENAGNMVFSNLEIEHYFSKNRKIRIGRLANSISESQFFGRLALEETSAHVHGRNVFINDAIEFDGSLRKGGLVYFVGLKPTFKPFNLLGAYAGLHVPFKNGMQTHAIVSVNRQFEKDLKPFIPDFEGKDVYGSYEFEIAHKNPIRTFFLNFGGNIGFRGVVPHTSTAMDFMKQLNATVQRKGDAFQETFMGSVGFHLHPSKLTPSLRFLPFVGVETEWQGPLSDRFSAVNVCAFCKFSLTRRMVLTYYCTLQHIDQEFTDAKPSHINGMVNFVRLSVVVGKAGRLYM